MTLEEFDKVMFTPEQIARIDREAAMDVFLMTLNDIRTSIAKMSQKELADAMGASQSEVSKIESRTDLKLSTIRRYVEALGGTLEVRAQIGDVTIALAR